MQSDVQIVRRPQNDNQMVEVDYESEHEHVSNPLLTAHRLLHGKYAWVVVFGLMAGVVGYVVTHHVVKDSYTSTGTVQVLPTLPMLLYRTEFNEQLSQYENFVETQVQLMMGEDVMDLAVQDPEWQKLAGPPTADSSAALLASLKVLHNPGELISISVSDPSPLRPAVAVNAIVRAYLKLHSNEDEELKAKTINELEAMKADLHEKVKADNAQTVELIRKYGVSSLDQAITQKDQEIQEINSKIREVSLDLATFGATATTGTTRPSEFSPELWSVSDGVMRDLLNQKQRLGLELQAAIDSGLMDRSPRVIASRDAIAAIDLEITKRLQFDNANIVPANNSDMGLHKKMEILTGWLQDAKRDRADMAEKNANMKALGLGSAELAKRLDEVNNRAYELERESIGHGRITAINYGTRPVLDSAKRKMISLAGGAGGFASVVGLFLVMGLANRKMHRIADIQPDGAHNRGLRLLGAVPMLAADGSMGDNTPAAQAVHRIRTRLQIEAATSDRRVMTVTSPASGNGKTSVITALGMSFASSGSKVLLIDCDLVGAGLTARLNGRVRRNIVDILRSQTHVTEEQLAQAARVANKSSDRFLQALIEFEYLDADAVKRAVTTHKESNLGLLDALNGEALNHCVAATRWPRLFVLPRGAATGSDAAQLSPLALRRLFHQARNAYDVVLIDTGPLFGSIEATLAASESDGTVLIVSRGESSAAVQAAVTDLKSMNCKVLGIVFNRAKARDVASYGYSSKSTSRSRPVASLTDDTDNHVGPVGATPGRNGDARGAALKKLA